MTNFSSGETYTAPFRPRARMLRLLGDELIGNARLAVFELVKNAYDADANEVTVRLEIPSQGESRITVTDDGEGMSIGVLRSIWLVPGDDHRQKQRREGKRSRKHHRLPLGEKGVGRFAVHKLGNRIRLTTRARGSDECVVEIDWNELTGKVFLDEAPVTISVRPAEVFTNGKTGTRIEIQELREPPWTRGDVRRLCNQITSICSPFKEPGAFRARLEVPGRESWIANLPDFTAILDRAIWSFWFCLEDGRFDWEYEFRKIPGLNLETREVSRRGDKLTLPGHFVDLAQSKKIIADSETTRGIGPLTGEFHVFDRDREVLRRIGDTRLLTQYLDEQGGIRVYRDGIRVYNYGEPGNDWLGLDLRRVNIPTRRISRNIVLGAIHLSLDLSSELVEKTSREGFVENQACEWLHEIVVGAISVLETERQIDKRRIRRRLAKPDDRLASRIEKPIQELRSALASQHASEEFEPYITNIERGYIDMQETLLAAGMSGLNLAVVFHEVERGVRTLRHVIVKQKDMQSAARQARELMRLLDGFSTLLRRDVARQHSARTLVARVQQFIRFRLSHHHVALTCPLLHGVGDFESRFSFRLVLGALNNLIDNALYWLRVRWADSPEDSTAPLRRLYLGTSCDLGSGPAIIVADNGVGFRDVPEHVVRPFFTRKPRGMGLGLYYANLAMELSGGQLAFPQKGEVDIPDGFDGAVVAMIFRAQN